MAISRTGPLRADVVKFGNVNGTFVNGMPRVIGSTVSGMQGTVAFGTGENTHDSSLAALGAASVGEISLTFTGPNQCIDASVKPWVLSCEVISPTVVRFYKDSISTNGANAADLTPTTHRFNAQRKVFS